MKSESRLLLATALSMAVFSGWFLLFPPQSPPATPAATDASAPANPAVDAAGNAVVPTTPAAVSTINDPQATLSAETVTMQTGVAEITLTNDGAVPSRWALQQYQQGKQDEATSVDLVTAPTAPPLGVELVGLDGLLPPQARYAVERLDAQNVRFRWRSEQLEVVKTYHFQPGVYSLGLDVELINHGTAPLQGRLGVRWMAANSDQQKPSGLLAFIKPPTDHWQPLYWKAGSVTRLTDPKDLAAGVSDDGAIGWAGVESRYFLAAIVPHATTTQTHFQGTAAAPLLGVSIATTPFAIPAGTSTRQNFTIYVGPKDLKALKVVGNGLDAAIDYGWFGFAAVPILYLLKFFYSIIHNYGVAIILLTLFIKALLHPITKASLASMRRMQLLQPQLKAIQEKYKGDRERLNAEMMQLFRSNKVNPMAGCLPMLAQIPIYIALYKVLWNAVELYRAPFVWFYRDLSAPDPYFISPALLAVGFYLQQKLTPNPSGDKAQQKMMQMMTFLFAGFMLFLPSGLVIYILVNTGFSILQQWLMNRGLGFRDLLRGNLRPKAA
ncbi:MAG: membrane protein insertase YidC [Deltaproteobacteria bacterium]|nr:membrane protein insertase YidC [Deltaproteobacteria bacterium]